MKLAGWLLVSMIWIAGCVARIDSDAAGASASADRAALGETSAALSGLPPAAAQAFCAAQLCNDDGSCPPCGDKPGTCDASFTCTWPTGGGGGGGGGGPFCAAALCELDADCAAACPRATNPRCVDHACLY